MAANQNGAIVTYPNLFVLAIIIGIVGCQMLRVLI